jgi:transcriptional regulator with XRE-family HTH domain
MTTTQLRQERLNRGWTLEYVGRQIGIAIPLVISNNGIYNYEG